MKPGDSILYSQALSNKLLSWVESIQFPILTPISLRYLILSFRLRLGLSRGIFVEHFSINILKAFFHSDYTPCQINLLHLIS